MTRRVLVLLVLVAVVAAGATAVLWWPGAPALTHGAMSVWPFSAEQRARRAAAAIDAHDQATLAALVRTADHANLAAADGETLLLHAIAARDAAAVGLLLARGADPERPGGAAKAQRSPLARAAELHALDLVGMLVAKGARVREVPGAPLLLGIPPVTPEELRALLAAGANPYAVAAHGSSLFLSAAGDDRPERLAIILQAPLPPDPEALREALGAAVANGRPQNVKLLLAAGASPKGDPTLAWRAASEGRADVLGALLDAGADPDAHPAQESPPLVDAAARGALDVVRVLLARPGKRDALAAALVAATSGRHGEIALALRAAGAPLPSGPDARQDAEHLLSRAALGPNPTLAALHRPVPPAWDGPLLVGTSLLEKCGAPGQPREGAVPGKWSDVDLPVSSLGRAEGDEVQALLSGGKVARARFGKVTCAAGECGQGWYEAALEGVAGRGVLAVAPPGFVPARARVSALRKAASRCAAPLPPAPQRGTWSKACVVWRGPGKLAVEVLEYSAKDDEYAQAAVHARLVGPRPGPWLDLGQKTGLAPVLAIEAPGAPVRLVLWRAGGVSTGGSLVCVARAASGSQLELGRCFSAGGQPCD